MSLPWVVPQDSLKCEPWYHFWQMETSCWSQNNASILHMWGPESYSSSIVRRRPWSTVSYALCRSRNTMNSGYWSILAISCAMFSYRISIPYQPPPPPWVTHAGHYGCGWLPSGGFLQSPPPPSMEIPEGQHPGCTCYTLELELGSSTEALSGSTRASTWTGWSTPASATNTSWGGGGWRPLSQILLPDPFIEMIHAEVSVPYWLVKWEPLYCCLYLPLQGDIVIDPKGFDVDRHRSPRRGCIFPQVQCCIVPCNIDHVLPRGLWWPCRRVAVPPFEDRVHPSKTRTPNVWFLSSSNILHVLLCFTLGDH